MKYVIFIISTMLLFVFASQTAICQAPPDEGRSSINTGNYANRTLNFYYYIPANKKLSPERMPVIVMIPGLGGSGEAIVHPGIKKFAEQEGFVIIAPTFVFDQANEYNNTCYHFPSAWSGDALIQIINTLRSKGIAPGNLYMFGFSAGAQVTGRFALLYPKMVSAAFVHASGGFFEPSGYVNVKFLMTVGALDADHRKQVVQDFMGKAKRYGIDAYCKEYANLGHSLNLEVYADMINFFKKVKDENRE